MISQMKKHIPVLILITALLLPLGACAATIDPSGSWRYRMTVTVETPEGIKTGSAVREVTVTGGLKLTPEMLPRVELKGEAVVIDLGQRGILLMLISGDYGADILFKMFPGKDKKGKVTLTPEQYPTFVRFRDLKDPMTVENVLRPTDVDKVRKYDPRRPIIDFEKAFGAGVNVKEVTIEITTDPVTGGIEKYLSWLTDLHGGYLHGGFTSRGSPLGLHGGDFQTGVK